MYELQYVLAPTITETDLVQEKEKMVSAIQKHHGTVVREEMTTKKKLAYEMKQAKMGWYGSIQFEAAKSSVASIQRDLAFFPSRLRCIITHYVEQQRRIPPLAPLPARVAPEPGQAGGIVEKKEVNLDELDQTLEKMLQDQSV